MALNPLGALGGYSLLFSQRADLIYLSLATYSEEYLAYLANPKAQILPEGVGPDGMEKLPHLSIREFGPFDTGKADDLQAFAEIVVALIVADMEAGGSRCFRLDKY